MRVIDLSQKRFGNLIALEKVGAINKRTMWRCLCDCGNTKILNSNVLSTGNTTSCGCKALNTPLNLTGQRFGRLVAISPTNDKKRYRRINWLCQCDCGNKIITQGSNLKEGHTVSCGCKRRDNQFLTIKTTAFAHQKNNAKKRNNQWLLTFDQYCKIIENPCIYCNDYSIRKNKYTKAFSKLNSVDRKNDESYYSIENSQSVCFDCQRMKSNFGHEKFLNHIKKITKFRGSL